MTFLNPIGLAGLISLPVILTFHLLFRRKKRYVVSHLGLWSFLDAETRGPRARRIPLTWILVLDLLIGALLSLAWAQPSLTIDQSGQGPRHLVILLDVSSSMRAKDGDAAGPDTRFTQARSAAEALLREANSNSVITVLSFGQQARIISDSRQEADALEPALLASPLDQIRVGETGYALPEALALGQAALEPTLPAEFHVITDGDFPLSDLEMIRQFAYPLQWHWVGSPADNQAVLDLDAAPLGGNRYQVFARLANFGSQAVTREAVLTVDSEVVSRLNIDIPAESSVPNVWQISTAGENSASSVMVSFGGSDPLAEDDSAAIGLQTAETIRVALVAENLNPIQQALQAVPGVDLQVIAPGDYASVRAGEQTPFELTIFRGFLPGDWPTGQVLVVDPPAGQSWPGQPPGDDPLMAGTGQEIAAGSLTQVSETNPLVAGIDFSGVRWARAWTLAGSSAGFASPLQAGGTPILRQGSLAQPSGENTQVTVLLADLTQGNFAQHPAFPILMANLVDLARQAPLPPGFQTGEALPLPAKGSYRYVQITPPQQPPIKMEGGWPEHWTDTLEPGLYHFQMSHSDGSLTEFTSGAQAGDAVESDLRPRDWAQSIASESSKSAVEPVQPPRQLDLRPWLLSAAILFFIVEAVLAWRR